TAEDGQPEVSEEGDRRFDVADGDADVLEFDGHAVHVSESRRSVQDRELPVLAQLGDELIRRISVASVQTPDTMARGADLIGRAGNPISAYGSICTRR